MGSVNAARRYRWGVSGPVEEAKAEGHGQDHSLWASFSVRLAQEFLLDFKVVLDISQPRVLVLFGPSGVGKTTALRCLAGLRDPNVGTIRFGSKTWFDSSCGVRVPPERRRIGFVHQRPTLFPHLDVVRNVAYGSGLRGAAARSLAREALAEFDAEGLVEKDALQLSGGEAQLVCLARALAANPCLFLGDEPFSSLDLVRRPLVRRRLRQALTTRRLSAILVTHDIAEALEVGDEIAVMIDGRVVQQGPVEDVVTAPADAAVARAVGLENLFRGVVAASGGGIVEVQTDAGRVVAALSRGQEEAYYKPGDAVYVSIPPAEIGLSGHALATESPRNRFECVVSRLQRRSGLVSVELECARGLALEALVTPEASSELQLEPGRQVTAFAKATSVRLIPDVRSS